MLEKEKAAVVVETTAASAHEEVKPFILDDTAKELLRQFCDSYAHLVKLSKELDKVTDGNIHFYVPTTPVSMSGSAGTVDMIAEALGRTDDIIKSFYQNKEIHELPIAPESELYEYPRFYASSEVEEER